MRGGADWQPLEDALARAHGEGREIRLWWRDDDAVAATPALERLLALAAALDLQPALAAIPALVEPSLAERLSDEPRVECLVHGYAHRDHAPAGEKKAEFGAHRPVAALAEDARAGLALARDLFGPRLVPVFVPPWNRFAPALAPSLAALGYRAVSGFDAGAATGIATLNTHLDPIDWHGTRSVVEPSRVAAKLAALIDRQGAKGVDAGCPIGILTHHLVHDEAIWTMCEALFERLVGHGRKDGPMRFLSAEAALAWVSSGGGAGRADA